MNLFKLMFELMKVYKPNQYVESNYKPYQNNPYIGYNTYGNINYREVNNYYKDKLKSFLYKQI